MNVYRFSLLIPTTTLLLLVSLFSCTSDSKKSTSDTKKFTPAEPAFVDEGNLVILSITDTIARLNIEIADSEAQRQRGLMYRTSMANDAGMLFIFDEAKPQSFWMENTYIPLDILFISSEFEILQISPNTIPYKRNSIECKKPSLYVLEVNAGYCKTNGVRAGHRITFERG